MSLLSIASLALDFGAVNRATFHQDGVTPESDTTHTVMLGLLAIDIASRHPELKLNVGLVAQLVYVHDLVEAKCGDTNSFAITPEAQYAKNEREREALADLIEGELREHSHLKFLLFTYENQECPEARFIRYLDKVTPKLTHALNDGAAFMKMGKSWVEVRQAHTAQIDALRRKYPEFADVVGRYLNEACDASEEAYMRRLSRKSTRRIDV